MLDGPSTGSFGAKLLCGKGGTRRHKEGHKDTQIKGQDRTEMTKEEIKENGRKVGKERYWIDSSATSSSISRLACVALATRPQNNSASSDKSKANYCMVLFCSGSN